jgi:hypothetical protein
METKRQIKTKNSKPKKEELNAQARELLKFELLKFALNSSEPEELLKIILMCSEPEEREKMILKKDSSDSDLINLNSLIRKIMNEEDKLEKIEKKLEKQQGVVDELKEQYERLSKEYNEKIKQKEDSTL